MTGKEKKFILDVIEQEGFEYSFIHYSEFKEINDNEFHRLRNNYLEARECLISYIEE